MRAIALPKPPNSQPQGAIALPTPLNSQAQERSHLPHPQISNLKSDRTSHTPKFQTQIAIARTPKFP
ncbi:hypothetical protein CLI64_05025 [Nostoc sp. CENA543]|uniref:hypothetical protein n=1 Tax=Nostoc sp. CENA543 TaxID=1869241 RepID=UPI000CA365D3|nr:hypothetical protein [Nostoc sp. CENA543]AUS99805.1 hypothetical protein CLI64_05025 [Nostoc sp. CENA543]